jgi:type I restriction enzyme S subunit
MKLSEVCELVNGRAYSKDELLETGKYPVLRVGNFFTNKNWYYSNLNLEDNKYCDKGDLLYAWSASFGPQIWDGGKAIYHYHIWKVIPNIELVGKRFMYFLLEWDVEKIKEAHGTGATMMHVSKKSMDAREIPIPPLAIQKQIVEKLDAAFTQIDKAISVAQQNTENAKALFQSYLNDVLETVGDGWVTKTLKEVCEKITDGTHQTPTYFDNGVIFLSSKNVTSGKIDWDRIKYIDDAQHLEMHKRVSPRVGDILLAKNGTTGVAAMVDRDEVFDIYVSLALLRTKSEVLPEYLLYFINSPLAKKQFNKRLKGIGVPNLHLQEIREVEIPFPKNIEIQKSIVLTLNNYSQISAKLEAIYDEKLSLLQALKKSILTQAFNGKLTKA